MPTSPSPVVQRRRARRRDEILAAAWDLARRQGIGSLSLRELARSVGMRAPSLYEYFADKDAIYDAMFRQGFEALDRLLASLPVTGDASVDLRDGTDAFLEFCAADPARYQLMFTRVIPGWEPSADAYQSSLDNFRRMQAVMTVGGVSEPDDIDLWTAISGGLAAQQAANDPGGDRYRRLVPAAVEMFLAHIDRRKDRP